MRPPALLNSPDHFRNQRADRRKARNCKDSHNASPSLALAIRLHRSIADTSKFHEILNQRKEFMTQAVLCLLSTQYTQCLTALVEQLG